MCRTCVDFFYRGKIIIFNLNSIPYVSNVQFSAFFLLRKDWDKWIRFTVVNRRYSQYPPSLPALKDSDRIKAISCGFRSGGREQVIKLANVSLPMFTLDNRKYRYLSLIMANYGWKLTIAPFVGRRSELSCPHNKQSLGKGWFFAIFSPFPQKESLFTG